MTTTVKNLVIVIFVILAFFITLSYLAGCDPIKPVPEVKDMPVKTTPAIVVKSPDLEPPLVRLKGEEKVWIVNDDFISKTFPPGYVLQVSYRDKVKLWYGNGRVVGKQVVDSKVVGISWEDDKNKTEVKKKVQGVLE